MMNDSNLVTEVEHEDPVDDGTTTILYTKETGEYARHMRHWRDVRDSHVSLFSSLSRMSHVTRVCGTSGERQGQRPFVHVKRVTLQVIIR
jgi:hypothetical protein